MAFVKEKISAEDIKKHKLEKLMLTKWFVDKERNAFVVHAGAGGDPGGNKTDFFELHVQGQIIKFYVTCTLFNNEEGVHYYVFMVDIPETCLLTMKETIAIIHDALYAFGFYGSWDSITAVHIKFADHLTDN
jgi:hypothetical protein